MPIKAINTNHEKPSVKPWKKVSCTRWRLATVKRAAALKVWGSAV
jgi:hypothetical protein